MTKDIIQLWDTIQTTLNEMDEEASAEERPYGLRCYGTYCRKLFPGSFLEHRCEEPITEGLARKLCGKMVNGKTIYALSERQYPNKKRSDVVIWLDGDCFLWIECKVAYKEHLNGSDDDTYDFIGERPYKPGSWKATIGGVPEALEKLNLLAEPPKRCTRYIGFLLLAFDRKEQQITIDELYHLLPDELMTQWTPAHGMNNLEGIIQPECFLPRADKGFQKRFWFWYRKIGDS
ncbi:MAG: hypothetical protein PVH19_03750 [Planctomycetia bacterium]